MTSHVLVSLRVRASPQRVFDVFTTDIGLWWKPNHLFEFTPGVPGTLKFEAGACGRLVQIGQDGSVFEIGKISVWLPGVRLAFSWRQVSFALEQTTNVEVRFDPIGDETRVTVEHRGWDSLPQGHIARHGFPDRMFLVRHAEWWRDHLQNMKREL
jgi:hypothetical protein